MSATPLFREEALSAQQDQFLGTVRIGRNPRFALVTAVSLLLGTLTIVYATLGSVTRKARLPGLLVPTLGTLNLTAQQPGVVLDVLVQEGQPVEEGQRVAVLGTDRSTESGDVAALVSQSLHQRRHALENERKFLALQVEQKRDSLNERLRGLDAELRQAEVERTLISRRVELAAKSADRFAELARSGFVSDIQSQQRQEEALDLKARAAAVERTIAALRRDAAAIRSERDALENSLRVQLSLSDRDLAQLNQEAAENSARGQVILKASKAGVVSALTVHVGQAVSAGQSIATIVPNGTTGSANSLEAHLYAPSRTAGFVQTGQSVWLRYAAYPYQKFGMAEGVITQVSRTPISPQDLPSGQAQALMNAAQSAEPLFRVTVALAKQSIVTYGAEQRLKPGLALEADVIQDQRAIWEWLFDPAIAALRSTPVTTQGASR